MCTDEYCFYRLFTAVCLNDLPVSFVCLAYFRILYIRTADEHKKSTNAQCNFLKLHRAFSPACNDPLSYDDLTGHLQSAFDHGIHIIIPVLSQTSAEDDVSFLAAASSGVTIPRILLKGHM